MGEEKTYNENFINPIVEDRITEKPHSLAY